MMETREKAIFDVCGTITKTNNTSAFIGFVLARDSAGRYCLFLLARVLSSLLSFLGIHSIFGRDRLRDCQIALLRGYSPERIREMSELYVDHLFTQGLLNSRVLEALQQEKKRGKAVFLVSAAIDPPIAAIAGRLGIEDYCSSELEVENGHYTGRLRTDLLGRKESVLDRIAAGTDLRDCSVYSDNPEDADFMAHFGRRHVILNTCRSHTMWDHEDGRFHFIANYDRPTTGKDPDSVNERTVKWIYVPFLYYAVSRFHREGVLTLLLREVVPATAAGYLLTNRPDAQRPFGTGAFSLILMPLSFWMFYSIYEIGGLINDRCVRNETSGRDISRIVPGVHIHTGLFVAVRAVFIGLTLALLPVGFYPASLYVAGLCLCLALYMVHTLIAGNVRVLTFTFLKLCRNSIPLVILASGIGLGSLIHLSAIFFVIDAPGKVYLYAHHRGLVKGTISLGTLRLANATFLGGLGAALYFARGLGPEGRCAAGWLFAIASYHAALDCLWIVRTRCLECEV